MELGLQKIRKAGDVEARQRPTRLVRESFGGSLAIMVACGEDYTLLLTTGGVWTCGCASANWVMATRQTSCC